jgi:SOS-response transcriptional repressor LexA
MPEISIVVFHELEQGKPVCEKAGEVPLPAKVISAHELAYKFRGTLSESGVEDGDILIAEPRKTAATGELVVVLQGGNAFLGHWWAKHGLRELRCDDDRTITGKLRIIGVVNLIVRPV